MKTISEAGEPAVLEWIEKRCSAQKDARLLSGPGDDAAVLRLSGGKVLIVTTDELVEGTHFRKHQKNARFIAAKLVRINLSDLAAMGGVKPLSAVAGAGIPGKTGVKWIKDFTGALTCEANSFGMTIAGGNLAGCKTAHFYMTVFGEAYKDRMISRYGARPGDILFSAGPLGEAAAGFELTEKKCPGLSGEISRRLIKRFWKPVPLLKEGAALAGNKLATSLIDNSDGLFASVRILAEKSGCGAEIELTPKCCSRELKTYCRLKKRDWRGYAAGGGEDYGLIFTVNPKNEKRLPSVLPQAVKIGRMRKGRGVKLLNSGLKPEIFSHF